jgi:hypothetical protein
MAGTRKELDLIRRLAAGRVPVDLIDERPAI